MGINITNQMKKERIKGSLIGCAYGDAMGMPTENMNREVILKRYPYGIKAFYPSAIDESGGRDFIAGQVTDDTIHTIILLKSLAQNNGKPDAVTYMLDLRKWIRNHPEQNDVIIGRSTRRALEAMDKGESMTQTGIWGTTNGASMKISSIGFISDYTQMEELIKNVYEICYPTHNSEIAIQGACVIASLVSYALQGGSIENIWDIALKATRACKGNGNLLGGAKLERRLTAVKQDLDKKSEEEMLSLLADFYGTGLETIETIPAVLSILQLCKGDPICCGQMAASLGGDTDTIGAIACAIAGAMNPAFPEVIVSILKDVNDIDFDSLSEMILPYAI